MEQYRPPAAGAEITIGDARIDVVNRRVFHGNDEITLSGRALDLFFCFVSNRDRLLTKREIAEQVWGVPQVEDNTIAQHVRAIRSAFRDKQVVRTVQGVGYKLNSEFFERPQPQLPQVPVPDIPQRPRFPWLRLFPATAVFLIIFIALEHPSTPHLGRPVPVTASRRAKQAPFLTDGITGYFTETEAGRYFLLRERLGDLHEKVMDLPVANPYVCGLSPDRRHLLLRSVPGEFDQLGPFYIADVGNSTVQPLGSLIGFDGAWSPSGNDIAISSEHDLLIVSRIGALTRTLARVSGSIWWPRWSPDGARIRFTENTPRNQARKLWDVRLKDGVLHQLFTDAQQITNPCCGSWTPDGKLFIFQTKFGDNTRLWVEREPYGWSWRVSKASPLVDGFRSPTLDPLGQEVFARGLTPRVEAVSVDLATGKYAVVLPDESGALDFSPDYKFIAISTIPGSELILKQLETGDERRLVASPVQAVSPKWSPDGRRVAFSRRVPGQPWRVCLTDWETGAVAEIYPKGPNQIDPAWSSDSRFIVFGGIPTIPDPDPTAHQIRIYDTRTGRLETLAHPAGAYEPAFSRNGTKIAAIEVDTQNLLICDFFSRTWRKVSDRRLLYPIWSRDNRWIYCSLTSPQGTSLVRVSLETSKYQQVLDVARIGTPSSYGRWFGWLPDGSLMAIRDHSVNDFYMFRWSNSIER